MTRSPLARLAPSLAWVDGSFKEDVVIDIDDKGRIAGVEPDAEAATGVESLEGVALLPGFVNAHSHAFQVGLRGLGETYADANEDFWSWRRAMYGLVEELDADRFEALCRRAFREMLATGITSVGEFHYFHHLTDRDHELDRRLLAAAAEAGIRLVVLFTYYRTGGIDVPLEGPQKRFATPDPDAFWRQVDSLRQQLDPATQSLAVAVHSVRAAEPAETAGISQEAARRGMVCHVHLEEQPREIADCRARYGAGPLRLMLEHDAVGEHFVGVHLTHSSAAELAEFFERGGGACICPLTEGNLADGVPSLAGFPGAVLSLGSDSNARISMLEEARWLEYGQRLRSGRRGVLRRRPEVAQHLLDIATVGGARALGVEAGSIEAGRYADFAGIDLTHPSLEGWTAETLAPMLVFGCGNEVVAGAWVGGRRMVGSRS